MVRRRTAGSAIWLLLLLVPGALIVLTLLPRFGEHGEGFLAEIIGAHLADTELFQAFAIDTRRWAGATYGVACLIGIAVWYLARSGWRQRMLALDVRRVRGYRGFIGARLLLALFAAFALASASVLLSATFRALPPVGWVVIAALAALFAGLQYVATVYGTWETRRLFRGR